MSCRKSSSLHPAKKRPQTASKIPRVSEALIFIAHLGHKFASDALEELRRTGQVELLVTRFDADKESIVRGALEPRHGEERAMRLWQFVQGKHAKDGKR